MKIKSIRITQIKFIQINQVIQTKQSLTKHSMKFYDY